MFKDMLLRQQITVAVMASYDSHFCCYVPHGVHGIEFTNHGVHRTLQTSVATKFPSPHKTLSNFALDVFFSILIHGCFKILLLGKKL